MTMKSTAVRPTTGLGHSMKPRQLTMMGLGSAIGAGLFLGSGAGIQAAGPAVLISYLVAGTLIILVMWALGEMAAANPNSGAFSVYAEKAMGRTAGGTQWAGCGGCSSSWSSPPRPSARPACCSPCGPSFPSGSWRWSFMVVFTGHQPGGRQQLRRVRVLVRHPQGGRDRRCSCGIGAALLLGLLPDVACPGLANITGDFAPNGLGGIAAALFVVIFAFGGTEIVSVAAAETENPAHSVGKAIRTVVWRILVFYIGSVFVIAAVLPGHVRRPGVTVRRSPRRRPASREPARPSPWWPSLPCCPH